jgi:hypothetical protein
VLETIWALAGVIGIDPGPHTMRQLRIMAMARQRSDWNRTASMMSLFANANRDPAKSKVFVPADFHPFIERLPEPKVGIEALKAMLPRKAV